MSCEDDFDEYELEHNQASTQEELTALHTLQLVLLNFDNYVGFNTLLKRTHDLIRKVNSSTKTTEQTVHNGGTPLFL